MLPPQLNWGGTRIANAPPSLNYPGWLNINRITQGAASVTKLMGRHTAKAGIYIEHSYKAQNNGSTAFQGQLNFNSNTNNPLDSQMAFSNAALGVFYDLHAAVEVHRRQLHLRQHRVVPPGQLEGESQADARLRSRASRMTGRTSTASSRWRTSSPTSGTRPTRRCSTPKGVCGGDGDRAAATTASAKDPRNGSAASPPAPTTSLARRSSARAISPTAWSGPARASTKPATRGRRWSVGPRAGAAYDVSGKQQLVLRGSVGLYFDRPDGNTVFSTVGNPPVATGLTQQWGRLGDLGSSIAIGSGAEHLGQPVQPADPEGRPVERRRAVRAAVAVVHRRVVRGTSFLRRARGDPERQPGQLQRHRRRHDAAGVRPGSHEPRRRAGRQPPALLRGLQQHQHPGSDLPPDVPLDPDVLDAAVQPWFLVPGQRHVDALRQGQHEPARAAAASDPQRRTAHTRSAPIRPSPKSCLPIRARRRTSSR